MAVFLFGDAESEFGADETTVRAALASQFEADEACAYEVVAAYSTEPDYDMACWFLLRKDGQLFELSSSHCSCNGYEGTFEQEPCPPEYLVNGKCW